MRYLPILALLALLCSCSGGGETISAADDAEVGQVADAGADLALPDLPETSAPDAAEEDVDILFFDTGTEMLEPGCKPGDGCFLDPCEENGECQSGWCVEHLGDGVCSQLCQEECPPGWSCKPVGAGGPDLSYICVSRYSNLCKPCTTSEGCKAVGGAEDACIDYGAEGNFCGGTCADNADCPWGFACVEAVTVDGVELKQCISETGVCPCASKSIELGLATPCSLSNEFGTCDGKRVCTDSGLTECDAAAPSPEECDGMDNDCDGEVDEPTLADGKYVELCDDGNPCTDDWCDPAEGCAHSNTGKKECVDGDACTVGDHCEEGVCVGTPIACDDDNPCTDDLCDGLGGCLFVDNDAACDDGDPCTVADQCKASQCVGVAVSCNCQQDADCVALEDDNLCNGTLVCSKAELPYKCVVDEATVVSCPAPTGPDAFCLAAACEPATGDCSIVPTHEGFACTDGNACTIGDLCAGGVCEPGVAANCNDGNPCTVDSCNSATGCVHGNSNEECNDGNACTTADACAEGLCVGGPALDCDDGNPCTDDGCDPVKGCIHTFNAAPCNDDNACTDGDLCKLGACLPGNPVDCDDDNPCTKDSCLPGAGCLSQFVEGPCEDGDPCTENDHCINGACTPGTPVVCNDENPCTDDSCGLDGACLFVPNEAGCDDGNACTVGDHCQEGDCVYGGLADCDDDNLCTTDSCDPAKGCLHLLNQLPCDDGNECTTKDVCKLGECAGQGPLSCDDGNVCTDDSCDPDSGCVHLANEAACDDGNECTTGDHCNKGKCTWEGLADCDDGEVCTTDSCDPDLGCVHTHNAHPCEDGNVCTVFDQCADGVCTPGKPVSCIDGNACTDDACDPDEGCLHTPNEAPCSDGNVCTVDDACGAGECIPGTPLSCSDDNLCTDDSCHPLDGCLHVANDANCDDDNVCTDDSCDPDTGCVNTPIDNLCDDDNACTEDVCDPDTGCVHTPLDDLCDDQVACTVDTCDPDAGCVYTPDDGLCDDDNVCTDDTCHAENDCQHANNTLACDDGSTCTTNDVCANGVCTGTKQKVKIYDSDLGVGTMLSCGGGHDGFNFVCHYKGYGDATGDHPTGDYQGSTWCWAIGEADGHINQKYSSCGGGCTHWAYVECWMCN